MKKFMISFYCLILLMATSACQTSKGRANYEKIDSDLGAYLQTVTLPKNLTIGFNPSEVKKVQSAKTYIASILKFDENRVIENLLQTDIIATNNYAEGPWYEAGDDELREYLSVYDGGRSLGMNSGVQGGISYSAVKDGIHLGSKLSILVGNAPGPPDNNAQEYGFNLKSDYGSFKNLSFKDYDDVLSELKEILSAVGFPEFTVGETYSLDLQTMLEHRAVYQEAITDFNNEDESEEYTWSKDDEAYLFFFQQVIDDIPLSNIYWQRPNQSALPEEVGATSIEVFYSKDGIRNIIAKDLLDVKKSVEEKTLISTVDALKKLIDSYSEILLENKTTVFSMELCYVAILKSESSFELVPAWIFGIAETSSWKDQRKGKDISLESYSYYVLNAISGERIEKASDIQ
ncbi:hypothetical protein KHA93_19715 [Bacillus sp. FJAT-49732]|uniref:Uncharacterized protein n=1 Tax=Lederbergia citrisecunda TaxID=2833583 RepID=A0A942TNZ9_9BACI|nr:hypothetical protein [Lederbergia citrisecunda]MBS4201836.1 hypothetical protein [Lederbergia citrisecunda]